ncbi:DUF308 domain-containing protein [Corynebacterium sp. A21]|uniref:DUF308 domain-containing protein n=1 Tax=Corynebacterium sp. A21 TaxID=3457318 RepID=UPI003FCF19FB
MSDQVIHSTPTATSETTSRGTIPLELREVGFRSMLVRGILGIIAGIILMVAPVFSVAFLAIFLVITIGIWGILDGFASLGLALKERRHQVEGWGWTLGGGFAALLFGIAVIVFPLSFAVVGTLMALWFFVSGVIIRGIFELFDRNIGIGGSLMGIFNIILGVIMAFLLMSNPGGILIGMVWVAGLYGVIFGLSAVIAAFKVRKA